MTFTKEQYGNIEVMVDDVKGVPRVWPTGSVFCDGCQTGTAKVKISARPPGDGYVARTMRLCPNCTADLWVGLERWRGRNA